MAASALAERAACAALYWARRRDGTAIRGVVAGLDDGTRREVALLLQGLELEGMSDAELQARMLDLSAKSRSRERKILAGVEHKSVATVAAGPGTDSGSGTFTGYLASFARDHVGDTIMGPAAVADSVKAVNDGAIQWTLTDSHSELASDVVATVTAAVVDSRGVRIQAAWMPTERAQALRKMTNAGAKLGLSIDYLVRAERPDGQGGRYLDRIVIVGGALTTHPMNPMAYITESKHAATVPVVDVYADAQGRHRADPGREAEDRLLEAASWPPRHWDRQTRLSLIRGAAEAKARRELEGDPVAAREQARRDQDNAYSFGLAATMARLRAR